MQFTTCFKHESFQSMSIAVPNLSCSRELVDRDQFVSRRNNRGPDFASDFRPRETLRGKQRERLRTDARSRFQNFLSFAQIRTATADEFARLHLRVQKNFGSFAPNLFLHHDCIRARRDRRPGENANRFARRDPQAAVDPRWLFADNAQRFSFGASASHNGITIHRGIIEARQSDPGDDIVRRKLFSRLRQRKLPRGQGPNAFENARERLIFCYHEEFISLTPSAEIQRPLRAGGEGGIRTLGTLLEYGALAKRCFRPLSHLTNRFREYGVGRSSSTRTPRGQRALEQQIENDQTPLLAES